MERDEHPIIIIILRGATGCYWCFRARHVLWQAPALLMGLQLLYVTAVLSAGCGIQM
jgi:hypothetical protein